MQERVGVGNPQGGSAGDWKRSRGNAAEVHSWAVRGKGPWGRVVRTGASSLLDGAPFLGRVSGRRLCRQLGWYRGAVLRPLGCGSFFILSKLRRKVQHGPG
ncbi:hypothetical protein Btus_0592 [Kyrpidia tusciae DSM 2912]|uniref:Uncharacterized protein n=1 Tax=Kyrpidia tusciae (strain DSM 2912 / NBRC 15312 / T2) TaxID=562970 RepID=D5WUG7_KYRT2|nr:hypothetical protein Btus_0592 [Kyrpidia tusciae DSM 2912]